MIVEMKRLVVEAQGNVENLGKSEVKTLKEMEVCANSPRYSPTVGQLNILKDMVGKSAKSEGMRAKEGGLGAKSAKKRKKREDFASKYDQK